MRRSSAETSSENYLVRKRLLPSSCMLVHIAMWLASHEEGDATYSCNIKRSIRRHLHTSVLSVKAFVDVILKLT